MSVNYFYFVKYWQDVYYKDSAGLPPFEQYSLLVRLLFEPATAKVILQESNPTKKDMKSKTQPRTRCERKKNNELKN